MKTVRVAWGDDNQTVDKPVSTTYPLPVTLTNPGSSLPQSVATLSTRDGGTLYRSGITAPDKLSVPGTLTVTAVTEAGSILTNALRNVAVSAGNRWGPTTVTTGSVTPTANQAVRIAFAAVTGADYYDIFLSTDANPKWVGRITEAQRAAGGIFSTVGVYSAGGAVNSIDIGIDGTGLAANVAPFAANNAFTPASVTPFSMVGYSQVAILTKLTVDDLRTLPSYAISVFLQNQLSSSDWHQVNVSSQAPLAAVRSPLEVVITQLTTLAGSTACVVLVDSIAGQGAALSIWVERIV